MKTTEDQESAEQTLDITKSTMAGDLIAATIDEIKAAPEVWQKMSQKQQQEVIDRVTNRVVHNVSQAVCILAAEARPVIRAKLVQVTTKDDLKASVLVSRHHPNRHEFMDSCGQEILLVLLNTDQYTGGVGDIQADPDQPALPLENAAGAANDVSSEQDDPLLQEAVAFVTRTQKASISAVQRNLKIGYNRAAHLVETLEQRGVVSPADVNGHRTVIVCDQ